MEAQWPQLYNELTVQPETFTLTVDLLSGFICGNPLDTANLQSNEYKYTTEETDMKIWNAEIFRWDFFIWKKKMRR